ncbi:hypothetical protein KB206_14945 [Microvirga sp. STS02]|uniref:hypothetical protein n=1 Tax=Hymenobacter negativus TaxID=2795026 RepID=UPI0018DD3119|nr:MULTISPECIES: hypothetical protein [Bacteria]MBH8570186.1 hypothetical protein [Hymenobacter negativus]MBR7209925.1 hypothetical protein [Microvirga sp. STS02]
MHPYLLLALRIITGLGGMVLVISTLSAAIRSFVLPRNEVVRLNVWVFMGIRVLFDLAAKLANSYERRDKIMAHYAPVALVALPVCWEALVSVGYTAMYWAVGEGSWLHCYQLSGSSLLTLGTIDDFSVVGGILTYSEATLGLLLLTLLLSYLPTIYQAFSRREATVALLELRAGTPPTAACLLRWLNHDGSVQNDDQQWAAWEQWFVEIEESHTSLPILSFFRSPQPGRSWVTAGGLILDTAALLFAAVDGPQPRQAQITFKAGCLALNRVYRFFDTKAGAEPTSLLPDEGESAPGRVGFDQACQELAEHGLKVCEDRADAWRRYCELRSRYTTALNFLARLTMAPGVKSAG